MDFSDKTGSLSVKLTDGKEEIKNLQEKLQDLSYELEQEKKRNKKIMVQNVDLQNQIDELDSSNRKLNKKHTDSQNIIEQQEESIKLKEESLNFVKEILRAQIISKKETANLYAAITKISDFIKEDLYVCFKNSMSETAFNEWKKEYLDTKLERWSIRRKKTWLNGKTTIALVGEFSSGKTSIINRLLSQDNKNAVQLPVGTEATTAIPTYITGSNIGTMFKFVSPRNEIKEISENTFRRVKKDILKELDGVSSLIKYFVLQHKDVKLKDITVLDTPGFSSGDEEDYIRTVSVINECDALFWVVDVNTGNINRQSLNIIKKHLQKPLYIIINKVDSKHSSEVDAVEKLIKNTFGSEDIKIEKILRFSMTTPLNNLIAMIDSVKKADWKDSYLDDLNSYIDIYIEAYDDELKELNKQIHEIKRDITNNQNIMTDYLKQIKRNSNDIESMTSLDSKGISIFKEDFYKIDKEDGIKFFSKCEDIHTLSEDIIEIDNCYKDQVRELKDLYKIQNEYQGYYRDLKNIKGSFYYKLKELKGGK